MTRTRTSLPSRQALLFMLLPAAVTPATAAAHPTPQPGFYVFNQCYRWGDLSWAQVRIDTTWKAAFNPKTGRLVPGGPVDGHRFVFTIDCRGNACTGARVAIDRWMADSDLLKVGGLMALPTKLSAGADGRGFTVAVGKATLRFDLEHGRVDYRMTDEFGEQAGSAPCSSNGVLWPPKGSK